MAERHRLLSGERQPFQPVIVRFHQIDSIRSMRPGQFSLLFDPILSLLHSSYTGTADRNETPTAAAQERLLTGTHLATNVVSTAVFCTSAKTTIEIPLKLGSYLSILYADIGEPRIIIEYVSS